MPKKSPSSPPPLKKSPPHIHRAGIRINIAIQILALGILLLGINYLSFQYYWRADFSRSQKFSLADQTRRVLRQMDQPIQVIVYFSKTALTPDAALYNDVSNLLKELQFSARKKLSVEYIDPARDLTRARELQNQYKFGSEENVVIIDYDHRFKIIPVPEMATWDESALMTGRGSVIKEFKGEQLFTTAFLELVKPDNRKIYFLDGHGESPLKETGGLSTLYDYVVRQGLEAESLNLANLDKIPDDAGTLVISGPRYDYLEREIDLLRTYWQKKGALFIALDPDQAMPRLNAFLTENGIHPLDNRVLRTVNLGFATGILRDVNAIFVQGSPVTKRLIGLNASFTGATQSLALDSVAAEKNSVVLRPILEASEGYWGESEYVTDGDKGVAFDPQSDAGPPLYISLSAEKGGIQDDRVELGGSKMMVTGNGLFLTDQALNKVNLDFFLGSLNWMLDRSNVSDVAPKSVQQFQLHLTSREMSRLFLYTMIVIPGIVALFGLGIWLKRRS